MVARLALGGDETSWASRRRCESAEFAMGPARFEGGHNEYLRIA
jgi:hypothetical protein